MRAGRFPAVYIRNSMRKITCEEITNVGGGVLPAAILAKGAVDCGIGAIAGGVSYFGAKALDGGDVSAGGVLVSVFGGCATNLASGGWGLGIGTATALGAGFADGSSAGSGSGGGASRWVNMLLE